MTPNQTPLIPARGVVGIVLMLALVGCQVATMQSGQIRDVSPGKGQKPNSLAVTNQIRAEANLPSRAQVLDKETPMAVMAAAGASYMSADGSLQATIPPGALSQDAKVRIGRADTGVIPSNVAFTPGIRFAMDLGGAQLASGAQIVVKAKVDARFIDDCKAHDANFDPAQYNLSQDAKGTWFMQMAVGSTAPADSAPATAQSANLVEVYPASYNPKPAAAAAGYKVLAATPSPTPSPSASASSSPSPSPTSSPSPVPTDTPSPTPTPNIYMPTIDAGYSPIDDLNPMPLDLTIQAKYPLIDHSFWWAKAGWWVATPDGGIPLQGPWQVVNDDAGSIIQQTVSATLYNNGSEFFSCLASWNHNCGLKQEQAVLGAIETYNQAILHHREPSTQMYQAVKPTLNGQVTCASDGTRPVDVAVAFNSDDINAKGPVQNAQVVFGIAPATVTTVTDTSGSAYQTYNSNTNVHVDVTWNNPYGLNAPYSITRADTALTTISGKEFTLDFKVDPTVVPLYQVTLMKHSPLVHLTLNSKVPVSNPVLNYTVTNPNKPLSTVMLKQFLPQSSGFGTNTVELYFYAPVSDDTTNHTIGVSSIGADNSVGMLGNGPIFSSAQRTTAVAATVLMDAIVAK